MEQDENRKWSREDEPFIGLPIVDLRKATLKPGIVDEEEMKRVIAFGKEYQAKIKEKRTQRQKDRS